MLSLLLLNITFPRFTNGCLSSLFIFIVEWYFIWIISSGFFLAVINKLLWTFFSVQFSRSIVSYYLRPHEPQHARPPCPSPTPGVHPNPCPPVGDAIQPSHPLSSPSPPDLNPSKHQCLFRWVTFLHQVAKVLEFQLQHQSYQWTPRTDLLSFNKPFKRHMLSFLLTKYK